MRYLYCLGLVFISFPALSEWFINIEAIAFKPVYNEVQIPNSAQADRFEITDISSEFNQAARFTLGWSDATHELQFLIAPLAYTQNGQFDEDIRFNNEFFSKEEQTRVRYQFNNYRLRYFYNLLDSSTWKVDIGGTAFIRDASIKLSQSKTSSEYANIGFVPLLALRSGYHFNASWSFLLDTDLAFAPQGRAIDFAALVEHSFNQNWTLAAGYRTIEGGADNEKVYSFSWLNGIAVKASYAW